MPTIITIGRSGDQWFDITKAGVSEYHAKLTIPDYLNAPWILEDNHSTNGTFIRDDKGQMVRISRVEISPLTFIQLGPSDVRGCSFYATKCLVENQNKPKKHQKEFEYIRKELSQFEKVRQKEKKFITWRRWANRYSWIVGIGFMWLWEMFIINNPDSWIIKWLNGWQNNAFRLFLRLIVKTLPMFFIATIAWWVNGRGKLDLAKLRMDAIRRCPNPECLHFLKDQEIHNGQCDKCKAHI